MGNQQSSKFHCFHFQLVSRNLEQKLATLFDDKGNLLRRIKLPLKAAELMIEEELGHVISPAEDLRRTGRFTAMKAEEELLAMKSYVLVPLSKLNRKLSETDMAVIESACENKKKNRNKKRKVSRVYMAEDLKEEEDLEIRVLEESIDISVGVENLGFMCRQRGYFRGWKPSLDTIVENTRSRFI